MASSYGLSFLTTWWLASQGSYLKKEPDRSHNTFHDLVSEIMHFYHNVLSEPVKRSTQVKVWGQRSHLFMEKCQCHDTRGCGTGYVLVQPSLENVI